MADAFAALAALTHMLRALLFAGGVALAAVATVDWAVRTRRINPFYVIARFMRGRVEPRLAGVERTVLRAGGHPSTTPWWALLAYVVFALLLIATIGFVGELLDDVMAATSNGAGGVVLLLVHWTFAVLRIALLIRVFGSWFPRLAASRWLSWSYGATEWMLRPLRGVLPTFGMIDLSPMVAYFALYLVQMLVERVLLGGLW